MKANEPQAERLSAFFRTFELKWAANRWFRSWCGFTKKHLWVYLLLRLIVLFGLLFVQVLTVPFGETYAVVELIITMITVWIIVEIVFVNTSTAFVTGPKKERAPIRSVLFLLLDYVQLAIAFSILYTLSWFGIVDGDGKGMPPTNVVYYSFVTFSTLGYGEFVPSQKTIAPYLVITQVVIEFYFVTIIVATLISTLLGPQRSSRRG